MTSFATYTALSKLEKSLTWVPKMRYPSWAKAKKTMKNITAKPARSLAHRARVELNWVIVLLKLMYLNTCNKRGFDGLMTFLKSFLADQKQHFLNDFE